MSALDWAIVILLNGGIIAHAVVRAGRTESSSQWFLGGRSVPWWIVGLSAFATAIDSSDLVADSGGVYSLGIAYFVTNWVGTVVGWFLLAHFIAAPMYRLGMYTNSEYLEARFGPTARVLSSLVQVQYRTMVIANITTTLYLVFAIVAGLGSAAWWCVGAVVLMALSYTILGGSRSVATTDAAQSAVMIAASLVLFAIVWNAAGGWSGIHDKLAAHDPTLPERMLHVGAQRVEVVDLAGADDDEIARHLRIGGDYDPDQQTISRYSPAWLATIGFVLVGMAYSVVNHEQSMRFFAARSLWDMKMAVVVAGLLLIAITFFNLMMGIMGRALFPSRDLLPVEAAHHVTSDAIYPVLVRDFTTIGLQGIVVAGILAAAISTYAGIGAAMSALLTRDVYARLFARNRDDAHYVRVGRWLTVAVVLGSFAYVPFLLRRGMMAFYLDLVATFVVPLLAIYLMGIFTPVHRKSGAIGLLAGVAYGIWRLAASSGLAQWSLYLLPAWMLDGFAAYPISLLITAGTMLLVSLLLGWDRREAVLHEEIPGWLRSSQRNASQTATPSECDRRGFVPLVLGLAVVLLGIVLSYYVFW